MDIGSGVLKLNRIIKAKRGLEKKLEELDIPNPVISETIASHNKTIAYIKNELNFNDRFDVAKECSCPPISGLDKHIEDEDELMVAKQLHINALLQFGKLNEEEIKALVKISPFIENESILSLPKAGDIIEEGEVQGVFIKVKAKKADGSISKQTRYVEVKDETVRD